jgi:hypothetical protein
MTRTTGTIMNPMLIAGISTHFMATAMLLTIVGTSFTAVR